MGNTHKVPTTTTSSIGTTTSNTAQESEWLMKHVEQGVIHNDGPPPSSSYNAIATDHLMGHTEDNQVYRDYHDLAITVVENEHHQPIVVHDLSGPVLAEFAGLERNDSIVSSILSEPIDLKSALMGEDGVDLDHHDTTTIGQATVAQEIASMAKNLIGCGALSLCNGIALCSNNPHALVAALFWIIVMGILFGYFCWLIAKVCEVTKRSTYRGIWQDTVGHHGSLAVSIANALKAALADLAYATILADTLQSLFQSIQLHVPRLVCLLLITIGCILPLCLLQNLAVLAPFSVVGTAGMFLTTAVMGLRYFDGSYQPGGTYYNDLPDMYQPIFGTKDQSWSFAILPFVCMVCKLIRLNVISKLCSTD
jgi:hypothetical protein